MSKLGQRILTAAIMVAAVLAVLLVAPPVVAQVVTVLTILLGAWEWSVFASCKTLASRVVYVLAVAVVMALGLQLLPGLISVGTLQQASLVWWALAFLWLLVFPRPISPLQSAAAGILVLVPAGIGLLHILASGSSGPWLVLALLAVVWASDIGAYFVGRRWGRMRLAPAVSPGKTWEGLLGGLALAGAVGALVAALLGLSPLTVSAMALSVAALSVVGDLTESMFKRNVGVKDSGTLIPGHGGVLDRMDSITAAVPLFVVEATWLGYLPPA
jgi:phosphatidate cytidylyltransferase